MFLFLVKYLMIIIMMLLSVAFYTLLERKILGYIQIRKGPNKVSFMGLLQPMADGMKLFLKEDIMPIYSNKMIYYMSPIFGLFLSMSMLVMFPMIDMGSSMKWSMLFYMCLLSMSVYSIMLGGWSSLSKYSNLGSYRSVAQTISYEISMMMILLMVLFYYESYSFMNFSLKEMSFYMVYMIFIMIWLGIMLAETNRTPFDLSESESELVSGFNTEYSGGGFALIFISEYMMIIVMSVISAIFFMNSLMIMGFMLMMYFLWIRGSFPRIRYDQLMYMSWKMYLPMLLGGLMFWLMMLYIGL